jgi:hypothetical protein
LRLYSVLLLALVVVGAWLLMAPGQRFLPAMAGLLADARLQRGLFSPLTGRSYATGRFQDRDVAIRLQLKRSRYGLGYLLIAMRTGRSSDLSAGHIEARAGDDAGRRALLALAARDLSLNVEAGWLKALWKPQGPALFPGRYSETTWREVLDAMSALATSLESAGLTPPAAA